MFNDKSFLHTGEAGRKRIEFNFKTNYLMIKSYARFLTEAS